MTIKDYFKEEQKVDNEIVDLIYYKNYAKIDFQADEACYISVLIAHPEESIWSLGWEVKDGEYTKPIIRKGCTSNVLTKGDIGRLTYGILRMLQKKSPNECSPTMKQLLSDSIAEADNYYDRSIVNNDKITL